MMKITTILLGTSVILLTACASKPTYQKAQIIQTRTIKPIANNLQGVPNRYQVKRGDTVSKIAARYGLNWREVARLNRLDKNYTIYTGQWLTLWQSNQQPIPQRQSPSNQTYTPRQSYSPTVTSNVQALDDHQYFTLPTSPNNRMIRDFQTSLSEQNSENPPGIWFTGYEGDAIFASQDGTVIYADDDNRLDASIGIRHADGFMTEYRFIKGATVRQGQNVKRGQQIASMRKMENGIILMEFLLSKNGNYLNPTLWLR